MPIRSFADKATEEFFFSGKVSQKAGWGNIGPVARRKLDLVSFAADLRDLRQPAGNHLEALKGVLRGFHSIRINERWRVVFRWSNGAAEDVQIDDYH